MVSPKKRLVPSIIARSQKELDERISRVSSARIIQLDIMDGRFVPYSSLNFDFRLPRPHHYEAHLMLGNPMRWVKKNYRKADTVILHFESIPDHDRMGEAIRFLRNRRKRVGLAIKPETNARSISSYLGFVDEILVMAVHPGRYGARFLPSTIKKVSELRKLAPHLDIEVDGGMTPETLPKVRKAGANIFICGSYIQESTNPHEAFRKMERLL